MPSRLHQYKCPKCTFTTFGAALTECANCGYKLEREASDAPSSLREQADRYKEAQIQKETNAMFRDLDKYLEGK